MHWVLTLSRCATISSYVPISSRAMLDGSFHFRRQFRIQRAVNHAFYYLTKSFCRPLVQFFLEIRQFHGIRVKKEPMQFLLCRGFWFRFHVISPNMTSTSSKVWRFIMFMFLNVCNAPLLNSEWKCFTAICSVIADCISTLYGTSTQWARISRSFHQTSSVLSQLA